MYHFKTKRALLAALIEAYAEHLDERLKHAESFFEGTPDETLVPGYILWFREFDKNNMGWADIGLSLLVQKVRDPELLQPVRDWYARLHERVAQMPPERRIRTLLVLMTMEGFFFTRKFGLDLMTQDEKNEVYGELQSLCGSEARRRVG